MLKRLRIAMGALALVLVLLGWGLLHVHQKALAMAAEEDAIDRSIARIQHEEQGYQVEMQQPANAKVLTQAQFLNRLFEEKSFSWTAAMEDLERVLPPGEQVTAIEPARAKDGSLTLRLRVSGQREQSVAMVRNMEHSRRFLSPRIAGENAENTSQGDLQPVKDVGRVSFDILAEYNPATLEERRAAIAAQKHGKPAAAKPMNMAVPRSAVRPGYVAPNAQPLVPRAVPMARRAPAPVPETQPEEPPPGIETGHLRNHDSNRNRPVNSVIPDPADGEPK